MRRRLAIAMLLIAAPALGQQDPVLKSWNQPVEPFRIIGNLFYVGASEVASYLVATPKGHIIIDGGLMETAPMIRANIEKLGFHFQDVRILLNTHAHFDHAGGLAALKEWGGATLMASERDAPLLARGGKNDPQFGDDDQFPAVTPDTLLRDGDHVTLGGSILTAHLTPGHTPGCTTWTTTVQDRGKPYSVVFQACGGPNAGVKLVGNTKFPTLIEDTMRSFRVQKTLKPDIYLPMHPESLFAGKVERIKAGEIPNPLLNPEGYTKLIADTEASFQKRIEEERAKTSLK